MHAKLPCVARTRRYAFRELDVFEADLNLRMHRLIPDEVGKLGPWPRPELQGEPAAGTPGGDHR